MQSSSENEFECLASTGVNAPGTMFPNSAIENLTGEVLVLYGEMELYLQRCCVPNRAEILSDGE